MHTAASKTCNFTSGIQIREVTPVLTENICAQVCL